MVDQFPAAADTDSCSRSGSGLLRPCMVRTGLLSRRLLLGALRLPLLWPSLLGSPLLVAWPLVLEVTPKAAQPVTGCAWCVELSGRGVSASSNRGARTAGAPITATAR